MAREQLIVSSRLTTNGLPVLDAYQVYIDEISGVDVDPDDHIDEIDPDDTTDAEVVISATVELNGHILDNTGDDYTFIIEKGKPVNVNVHFSHYHVLFYGQIIDSDGNMIGNKVEVTDILADPDVTKPPVMFNFPEFSEPGLYTIEFSPHEDDPLPFPFMIKLSVEENVVEPVIVDVDLEIGDIRLDHDNLIKDNDSIDSLFEVGGEILSVTTILDNLKPDPFRGSGNVVCTIYSVNSIGFEDGGFSDPKTISFTDIASGEKKTLNFLFESKDLPIGDYKVKIAIEDVKPNPLYLSRDVDDSNNMKISHTTVPVIEYLQGDLGMHVFNIGDPVNVSTGAFNLSVDDLTINGKNNLTFTRSYSVTDYRDSSFGRQWRHSYDITSKVFPDYIKINLGNGSTELFKQLDDGLYSFDESKYTAVYIDSSNNVVLEFKGDKTYYFDNDNISKIVEGNVEKNFTYLGDKVITVSSSGSVINLSYENDKLVSVSDYTGRNVSYAYTGEYLTGITNVDGHTWTYAYDTNGRIEKAIDPNGVVELINSYDSEDKVVSQINKDGTGISYGHSETATTFTERDGTQTVFHKDSLGRIIRRVYVDGEEKYVFDENNNVIQFVDKNNKEYNYYYNLEGNVEYTINPLNEKTIYSYDSNGQITKVIEADGSMYSYMYNSNGDVVSTTDPLQRKTEYVYDVDFNMTKILLPNGSMNSLTYDSKGNVLTTVDSDSDGNTVTYAYDDLNRVNNFIDANGHMTSTDYLPSGKIESITYADGTTTSNNYNALNQLVAVTDKSGNVTTYGYTEMGDVSSVTYPDHSTMSNEYDVMQNLIKKTFADGSYESYTYDNANRLTVRINAEGHQTSYGYDNNGNIISEIDAKGQKSMFAYDALNRLISKTDALGQTFNIEYDSDGNITALVDELDNRFENLYDIAGQLLQTKNGNGQLTSFDYDTLGRLVSTTNALEETTTYHYNALNKVTKVIYSDDRVEEMTYDANGNLITQTNALSYITEFTHENMNKLISITDANGQISTLTYDLNGQVISETNTNGFVTTYAYDVMNRIISKINANGHETNYVYDALGRVIEVHQNEFLSNDTFTNELATYYAYNNEVKITHVSNARDQDIEEGDIIVLGALSMGGRKWMTVISCP